MALEFPPQDFFPSASVRFVVRFDEFAAKSKSIDKAREMKPPKNLKGTVSTRANLKVVEDTSGAVRRFRLDQDTGGKTDGAGTDQTSSEDKLTHEIGGVIPKTADWKQNGIRTADTLSLTVKWIDMPIDPRTIRACAVEFFLGTVRSQDYGAGIAGGRRASPAGSGGRPQTTLPLNLVPETYTDVYGQDRTNSRFLGWVDTWELSWGDGEPIIKMECRDNTQLLLKQEMGPSTVLDAKKPIDEAVALFLANFPQLEDFSVEYLPGGQRDAKFPPRFGDVLSDSSFKPNLGPQVAKGGGGDSRLSVWDYLADVCGAIGHIIRVEGLRVIIQRPSTFMNGAAPPREDDPYVTRVLPSGSYDVRTFLYGRNVSDLSIKRDFARKAPGSVEVRCYDGHRKNILVGRFPLPKDKDKIPVSALPGDGKNEQKWTVYRVSGVRSKELLNQVAEDIYNNVHRNELSVSVKTRNLASFGGGNEDPDLLDMKPGDTFKILVNRDQDFSTMADIEKMLSSQELNTNLLQRLGYSPEFSAAYAKAYTDAGFQEVYRVKEMGVRWDAEQGVSLDVTGINYVEVRLDLPSDETKAAADAGNKPRPNSTSSNLPPKGNPAIGGPA